MLIEFSRCSRGEGPFDPGNLIHPADCSFVALVRPANKIRRISRRVCII